MKLSHLSLKGFRNYKEVEITPSTGLNIFVGQNGQGKTNILEGIHLLANLKSFRFGKNVDFIKQGDQHATLEGKVDSESFSDDYRLMIARDQKIPKVNGKAQHQLANYLGKFITVSFHPGDLDLIRGGPDLRRKSIDRLAFHLDFEHLKLTRSYDKVMKSRNQILKNIPVKNAAGLNENQKLQLETWEQQLADLGSKIALNRFNAVGFLTEKATNFYSELSGKNPEKMEKFELKYLPNPPEIIGLLQDNQIENTVSFLNEKLMHFRSRDLALCHTGIGAHRDDLDFILGDEKIRTQGSQGQQRTAVLALKLAEIQTLVEQTGSHERGGPVLIIDDISSELDADRRKRLFDLVKKHDLQTFVSTTEENIVQELGISDCKVFHIENGTVLN